jgi:hypothetical protein
LDIDSVFVVVHSNAGCGIVTSPLYIIVSSIYEYDDPFFRIKSIQPHPISNEASVSFVISQSGHTSLSILDLSGRTIAVISSELLVDGDHTKSIPNSIISSLSNGTYFIVLEQASKRTSAKITINK